MSNNRRQIERRKIERRLKDRRLKDRGKEELGQKECRHKTRRKIERRQCNCWKGECQQERHRQKCIELAKHIGVLSVGLSVATFGIAVGSELNNSLLAYCVYLSMTCILYSFCFSTLIIARQLPYYLNSKTDLKGLKIHIWSLVIVFILGVFLSFVPLLHHMVQYVGSGG